MLYNERVLEINYRSFVQLSITIYDGMRSKLCTFYSRLEKYYQKKKKNFVKHDNELGTIETVTRIIEIMFTLFVTCKESQPNLSNKYRKHEILKSHILEYDYSIYLKRLCLCLYSLYCIISGA